MMEQMCTGPEQEDHILYFRTTLPKIVLCWNEITVGTKVKTDGYVL